MDGLRIDTILPYTVVVVVELDVVLMVLDVVEAVELVVEYVELVVEYVELVVEAVELVVDVVLEVVENVDVVEAVELVVENVELVVLVELVVELVVVLDVVVLDDVVVVVGITDVQGTFSHFELAAFHWKMSPFAKDVKSTSNISETFKRVSLSFVILSDRILFHPCELYDKVSSCVFVSFGISFPTHPGRYMSHHLC